jgi:hypothetical protein
MKKLTAKFLGTVVLLLVCSHVARASSTDHVFYVGANQHVWDVSHVDLSTTLTAVDVTMSAAGSPLPATNSPLAGYFIDSEEFIYYASTASDLIVLYLSGGSWHYTNLSTSLGVFAGPGEAFVGFALGAKPYLFIEAGGSVEEVWGSGGVWHLVNAGAGAPSGILGPASLAGFTIDSEILIYYIALVESGGQQEGHVEQLINNGEGWVNVDITAAAGAPPVSVFAPLNLSGLTGFSHGLQAHVYYLDANGHVHQLYSNDGSPWTDTDMTMASGGPAAVYPSQLESFYYNSRYSVFSASNYLGSGQINYLYAPVNTDTWTNNAAAFDFDDPNSLLSGFNNTTSNTAHLYMISDSSIQESYTDPPLSNDWFVLPYTSAPAVQGNTLGSTFH